MDDGGREVSTYEVRAPTELQLSYLHGTCDTTYGSRVHETSGATTVWRSATRWGRPMGRRVVLDSSSGVPLLPQSGIPLAAAADSRRAI